MKISVLVVAHNEEKHIKNCIESLLCQTITPDEILVVCHNCTDKTEMIACSFKKIIAIKYDGPDGVPFARIKGFEEVTGDIVACLDGDSIASRTWLFNITKSLIKNKNITLVAGYVILTNNFFSKFTSFRQFVILKKILKKRINYFAWGSNFACRKIDYEKVGGILPLIELRKYIYICIFGRKIFISHWLL